MANDTTIKTASTNQPVWWIEWKHRASRTMRINTVPLNNASQLLNVLNHATAFAEDHKVTVSQYWPQAHIQTGDTIKP
jgi:hypothetical protein